MCWIQVRLGSQGGAGNAVVSNETQAQNGCNEDDYDHDSARPAARFDVVRLHSRKLGRGAVVVIGRTTYPRYLTFAESRLSVRSLDLSLR